MDANLQEMINANKKKEQKKVIIIVSVVGFFFLVFLIAVFSDDQKSNSTTNDNNKSVNKEHSINLTTDDFKYSFNSYASEIKFSYRINSLTIDNSYFSYAFNSNISILGDLNISDNSIRSIVMLATGDGTSTSGVNILIMIGMIIHITNPELNKEEISRVFDELGLTGKFNDTETSQSTIRNGIKYYFSFNQKTGIQFSVKNSNDTK